MKRLALMLALTALLPLTGARAQIAGGGGPIDVTADELEMFDAQKLAVWRGKVEALQGPNRMLADQLNVYFSGRTGAPAPNANGQSSVGRNWGEVQRLVADGNVFFISPQQTARGLRAVYEVAPDTITMTGDVVIVTGENVVKGDKLVIQVKTGHATIVSDAKGRNQPERVRGVFYSNSTSSASKPEGAAAPAPAASPPSSPAP